MKNMKSGKDGGCAAFADAFYGSATVGERGQIVIPAEARAEIGFAPGDKVLIMRHPIYKGVMLFKIEAVREFLDEFAENLNKFEGSKEEVV
jgi:AbrB family looped-hinge helix DNA binding protein